MNNNETRDMAITALTKIQEHMTTCDQRYSEQNEKWDRTIAYLQEMKKQISDLDKTIAEAKGAAKMGKVFIAGISGLSGVIGGLTGHIAFK